ncbi:hypothetical protein P154DRAFT_531784 [Amniculicola lignicola CBS 123094]|uniref:Uncharacterized protein n=1 Tax=Amniculicola lignicola CBS 123094 TaxID=1392246 RepID=A0A6A5WRD6_9PLEO|nr:hypothetical protein P154DRAFT_531784 [Amniculicola lignicola CBS 123094]
MPSSAQHFQPPPPIRTPTTDSQKSQFSGGAISPTDMLSPTSTFSRGSRSPTSPTEESFFGAIASKMRRGRSRSRSRIGVRRDRSKSPMVMPPEQMPRTSAAQPASPTYASQRPQQARHASSQSQPSAKPSRPSLQGPSRRSTNGSDMWRGRHSNSWLFNDFSITESTKDLFHLGRKS